MIAQLLDPAAAPGRPAATLCSALDPAALLPTQWQLLQNLRTDRFGSAQVRGGSALLSAAPVVAPATVGACLGMEYIEMDGTRMLVSAHVVTESASTKVRIYSYNLSTWAATELTSSAGWAGASGDSRLTSTTSPVQFTVVRLRRRFYFGAVKPARDVLVIQNGVDDPRIYDPRYGTGAYVDVGQALHVHKKLTVPTGAGQFRKVYRFAKYLKVAQATGVGRTYTNSGVSFTMAETTAAPYNAGESFCIKVTGTNMAVNAYCNTRFTTGGGIVFNGEQMVMIVEGTLTQVTRILDNVKVEINQDNVVYGSIASAWQAVYDPSATGNDAQRRKYDIITFDATTGRHLVIFYGLASIDTSKRTCYHFRMTRTTAAAATTTDSMIILMIACASSGIVAGTDFAVSYRDAGSHAESPSYVSSSTLGEALKNMGGPDTGLSLPALGTIGLPILLDYSLFIKNTDSTAQITGGLQGTPSVADVYAAYPVVDPATGQVTGLSDYLWMQTLPIWVAGTSGPNKVWSNLYSSSTFIEFKTDSWIFFGDSPIRSQRDPVTPRPGEFNEPMPIGTYMAWGSNRSFVGNLYEGSTASPGDYAFSGESQPFRYQSLSTAPSDGGRGTLAGDTVQGIFALAAGASGSSRVYVLGRQQLYAAGSADASLGQPYSDAINLSRPVPLGPHGTGEPGSLCVYANVARWVDQENQTVAFAGGQISPSFSRNAVDDKLKAVPAARRGQMQGCYFKDRFLIGYTPAAGSANQRLLGYHAVFGYWEFDDLIKGDMNAARMARIQDTSQIGPGTRLVMAAASGGALYAYDEGAAEYDGAKIATRLTSRAIEFWRLTRGDMGQGGYFSRVGMLADSESGASLQADRYYEPHGAQYRSSQALDNAVVSGARRFGDDTGAAVTEVTATGQGEGGMSGYVDLQASLTGAAKIRGIWVEIEAKTNIDKVGASA